jgi:sugar phosphate isomerase/epimerase
MQTAVATFTLRDLKGPHEQIEVVDEAGFDGIEFAQQLSDDDSVKQALSTAGLTTAATSLDPELGLDQVERVATIGQTLNTDALRLAWQPPEAFGSNDRITKTAEQLTAFANSAKGQGFTFHYHNHNHEFSEIDAGRPYDLLVERTDNVGLEFDIGWARLAGVDPVSVIERYGDRISHLHFTDVSPGPETTQLDTDRGVRLGEGVVDLEGCTAAAEAAGIKWAIYEHWEPENPRESVEHAAGVLDELVGQ